MTRTDFETLAAFLYRRSGLVLTPDKGYLLESRLIPVLRRHEIKSLADLAGLIQRQAASEALTRAVVEAMTTNESSFYRDLKPFEQIRQIALPALIKARASSRRLRIWSAACAAGQEPYSLAMLLDEMAPRLSGWSLEILATDLSQEMVDRTRAGSYSQFEIQRGLPITQVVKYFSQQGDRWVLEDRIRRMVTARTFNLLEPMATLGMFDLILCRNVLIYFDPPSKRRVLDALAKQMAPDGFLLLGGAETVLGLSERWVTAEQERGLYRPAPAEAVPLADRPGAVAVRV